MRESSGEGKQTTYFFRQGLPIFSESNKAVGRVFWMQVAGGEVKEEGFSCEECMNEAGVIVNNFLKMRRGVAQRLSYPLW